MQFSSEALPSTRPVALVNRPTTSTSTGEKRVDVDSLVKGRRNYPAGSYIGGELIVLTAKSASEPLVFHLSTKSRQGRSTIVIQCGKFPAELNGTSVLEEAYSFLESRFRQYIRIQADFDVLEVLDVVQIRGKPKRIHIRYGVGANLLAQDGGVMHIRNDAPASWFVSQESLSAEAEPSLGEEPATKTPPLVHNSPLAAFPTSPPTSDPMLPEQRGQSSSYQTRVQRLQSRDENLPERDTPSKKKLKTEQADHRKEIIQIDSTATAANQHPPRPDNDHVLRALMDSSKSIHMETENRVEYHLANDVSAEAQPVSTAGISVAKKDHEPVSIGTESGTSTGCIDLARGVRVSQLLADPMLLSRLSLEQREALRKAAEKKWLQRNPLFVPTPIAPATQKQKIQPDLPAVGTEETAILNPSTSGVRPLESFSTGPNPSKLSTEPGLIVPRTPTSNKVLYRPLETIYSMDSSSSPLVNVIALVCDTQGPREIGQRGDILYRLRLVDPSRPTDGPWLSIFARNEERRLPSPIPPGSVVLLRGTMVSRDSFLALKCPAHADWAYTLLLLDAAGHPGLVEGGGKRQITAPPLSRIEINKMSELQQWYLARFPPLPVSSESETNVSGERQHSRTWSTVRDRDFVDLTVEILHVRHSPFPTKREFIVTDYTKNDNFMFNEYPATDIPEVGYVTLLTLWDGVALSADLNVINDGDIVSFRNVAIKASSSRYGMEGNVREFQDTSGHQYRRFRVLNPQKDPLAIQLLRRREQLRAEMLKRRTEATPVPLGPEVSTLSNYHLSVSNAIPTSLQTRHNTQPFSSISDILRNPVPDNRFRLKAWVSGIQTRLLDPHKKESRNLRDLVVVRCTKCNRYFEEKYCIMCKTMLSTNLEYHYLFVIHLKEKNAELSLPVIVSSKYMSNVLPSLPAVTLPGNDEEKDLISACRQVEEMLQGCVVDGKKQCPLVDWSLTRMTSDGQGRGEAIFASGMEKVSTVVK